jgi:hydroxyethylthiazole kinase
LHKRCFVTAPPLYAVIALKSGHFNRHMTLLLLKPVRRIASATTVTISSGHPLMAAVTGTGCLSGAVLAAFLAVEPKQPLQAAASAFLVIGVAAEMAARQARGPGTFEPAFLDALAAVDANDLAAMGRIDHAQH